MELADITVQRCRSCGETKPIDEFDIRSDTGRRKTQCKDCRRTEQRERWRRVHPPRARVARRLGVCDTFVCTRCGQRKPASDFPPRRRGDTRLQAWCRACFAAVGAAYYAANREREIARIMRNKRPAVEAALSLVDAYLVTHPCVDCGESDPVVLEFDHVVGSKRMDVSRMAAAGYPLSHIEAEIARCEVRCGNDHRRRTHERRRASQRRVGSGGAPGQPHEALQ